MSEKTEIVKMPLNRGANVKARDAGGKTALDYAAEHKRSDFVQLLNANEPR